MAIVPLPALDRTSATFKTDTDTFFGEQLPAFSEQAEAMRLEVNANQLAVAEDRTQTGQDRTQTGLDRTAVHDDKLIVVDGREVVEGIAEAFGDVGTAVTQAQEGAGTAIMQAGIATEQAAFAEAEKVEAVNAASTAAAIVNRRIDTATAIADVSIIEGAYFSTPSAVVGEAAIIWRKVGGAAVDTTIRVPSTAFVAALAAIVSSIAGSTSTLRIVEVDSQGQMSRYVDATGKTFVELHPDVVLPGAQVSALPFASLASSLASKLLPDGAVFISSPDYPFAVLDSQFRFSELTLEKTGRFPAWVARALAERAGAFKSIGASVAVPECYLDATTAANNAAITALDTGQATLDYGIAPLYVSGGEIVHGALRADNNAGYLEVALSGKARRIGCAYRFPVGAGGALTLVLPSSSWVGGGGTTPAGLHLVLNASGSWNASYLNGSESFYTSGNVGSQTDGVVRYLDVFVDGDTVTIRLPDGTTTSFTDARVSANTTNLVIWELYEFTEQAVRPRFLSLWAEGLGLSTGKRDTRPLAALAASFTNA